MSISDSCNEGSDIEIEKISHSTALEQCRLLLQYVEQQDPAKFVRARHAKIAKSVATHSIEYGIYEAKQQKRLTDFFIKERENHNSYEVNKLV